MYACDWNLLTWLAAENFFLRNKHVLYDRLHKCVSRPKVANSEIRTEQRKRIRTWKAKTTNQKNESKMNHTHTHLHTRICSLSSEEEKVFRLNENEGENMKWKYRKLLTNKEQKTKERKKKRSTKRKTQKFTFIYIRMHISNRRCFECMREWVERMCAYSVDSWPSSRWTGLCISFARWNERKKISASHFMWNNTRESTINKHSRTANTTHRTTEQWARLFVSTRSHI